MGQEDYVPSRVVLLGLAHLLASELKNVLSQQGQIVHILPSLRALELLGPVSQFDADLIFCAAEPEQYVPLLQIIKRERLDLPVVVVSRLPEVPEWIEALEEGACDYCAPPFESSDIQWILENSLKTRRVA